MLDITTCKVLNESDKNHFRLFVEWINESRFNVLVLRPTMAPLSGEMTTKDIKYYSEELSKSSDEYLKEVKHAFSGKDTEVQFFLRDYMFTWKRNKVWTLGKIKLRPISEIEVVSEMLERLLAYHAVVQENVSQLEKENEYLKDAKLKLTDSIEEMIKIKSIMERDLYRKFLSILNTKKKKIRELQAIIKNNATVEKSVFDGATDQSDCSEEEDLNKKVVNVKKNGREKRKHESNNDKITSKSKRIDISPSKLVSKTSMNPKPSTSKDFSFGFDSLPDSISSTETECDIELKDPGDTTMAKPVSCLDGTEELEEDLFSQ